MKVNLIVWADGSHLAATFCRLGENYENNPPRVYPICGYYIRINTEYPLHSHQ